MTHGARIPEELDTLLEDAFVARDVSGLRALFDRQAVLTEAGGLEARGAEEIARVAGELWAAERTYVAGPRRVVRARGTALVVSATGIHVLRRGRDRAWRSAISFLSLSQPIEGEHP